MTRDLGSLAGLPRDAVLPTITGIAPSRDAPQAQVGPTAGQRRGTPDDTLAGVMGSAVSDILVGPYTATQQWPSPSHCGVVHTSYQRRLSWHAHDPYGHSWL